MCVCGTQDFVSVGAKSERVSLGGRGAYVEAGERGFIPTKQVFDSALFSTFSLP